MLKGCEQASRLTASLSISSQAPQQISGLKMLECPLILQLVLEAILGTGETAALGAATATVLESARMNTSEEIVSPRIANILCICSET